MKIIRLLPILITAIILLFYGVATEYILRGGKKLGVIAVVIKNVNSTAWDGIMTMKILFNGGSVNPQLIKQESSAFAINKLKQSLYTVLVTKDVDNPMLVFYNLTDSAIEAEIDLPIKLSETNERVFLSSNFESTVVGTIHESNKFFVFKDKQWRTFKSDYILHHRIDLVDDSLLYVNIAKNIPTRNKYYSTVDSIRNDGYAVYNLEGKLLESVFVLDLIPDLKSLSHDDFVNGTVGDPLHVNDVEVAPRAIGFTGPIRAGDVFLSLRHVGILHVRNKKVIRVLNPDRLGYQHDVDIVDNKSISVSNNASQGTKYGLGDPKSELVFIDVETGKVHSALRIPYFSTHTEGQVQWLGEYMVVENQNKHELLIFKKGNLIYRGGLAVSRKGFVDLLNWQDFSLTLNSNIFL